MKKSKIIVKFLFCARKKFLKAKLLTHIVQLKYRINNDFGEEREYNYTAKNINNTYFCTLQLSATIKSPKLGQFFGLDQSIIDKGNLFQCFCSEESNLNIGRLVNVVLLDHDPNLLLL